jgi:hypothetical protein
MKVNAASFRFRSNELFESINYTYNVRFNLNWVGNHLTCICRRAAPKSILPRYTELVKEHFTCVLLLFFVSRDRTVALSEFKRKRMTVAQCDFLDSVLVFINMERMHKSRTKSASLVVQRIKD